MTPGSTFVNASRRHVVNERSIIDCPACAPEKPDLGRAFSEEIKSKRDIELVAIVVRGFTC